MAIVLKPSQGEVLLLLAHRSKYTKNELAKMMKISASHLSKSFNSQELTPKIRESAESIFGVGPEVWSSESIENISAAFEPNETYYSGGSKLTADEVFDYMEKLDARHFEERNRLLKIIENLTLRQ